MKICYNNKEVEQALIELNVQSVQFGYVGNDEFEFNLSHELPAMQDFLNKITYKAIRIYMLDENIKNEVQDEEIGYIITTDNKRKNIYYAGDYYKVTYYTIED